MTDSLRDRIAASLAEADGMDWDAWSAPSQDGYLLRADAVIAELGLRVQVAGPDGIAHGQHRYISDWITNE